MMKNILLIDNDDDSISLISSILLPEEYSLDIAENILKGYQQTLKKLPDLIIISRDIYENDNPDVLNQLRDETYVSTIPFIFITDNRTRSEEHTSELQSLRH